MCGDDDTHPLGGRWCGDGSLVAPRRDVLVGWLRRGGWVETHGDLRSAAADSATKDKNQRVFTASHEWRGLVFCLP